MIGKRALDDPRNQLVTSSASSSNSNLRCSSSRRRAASPSASTGSFSTRRQRSSKPRAIPSRYRGRSRNPRDYGVPQDRQRLFLMGAEGLPAPAIWNPTRSPRLPTCRDAPDDLPNAEDFEELTDSNSVRVSAVSAGMSVYAREKRCLSNDAWHYGYLRELNPQTLTASLWTARTDISRRGFRNTPLATVEPISDRTVQQLLLVA